MGLFAHSYVMVGSTPEALIAYYLAQGTRAYIFPAEHNSCAICDDNDDEADLGLLVDLTAKLHVIALLGQVFDSTVFVGTVFNKGVAIDEYIDYPDYLSALEPTAAITSVNRVLTAEQRAAEWASLFGAPHQENALADVFRRRTDYLFAEDFHTSVLEALTLPAAMVGQQYIDVERAYRTEPEARKVLRHASDGA